MSVKKSEIEQATIGNAAGFIKIQADAEKMLRTAATRITIGSITVAPRDGNTGDTYWFDEETGNSFNALGMPNRGIDATLEWLPEFASKCRQAGKELAMSVAGFSPAEYAHLVQRTAPHVDIVELNAGCGNIWGTDGQKPVVGQHPDLLRAVLEEVKSISRGATRIGIKLSRVKDEVAERIAMIINESDIIDEVVQGNTWTNQSAKRPDGRQALAFRESEDGEVKHVGGLGGRALKLRTLQEVSLLVSKLPARIAVVACGGLESGQDLINAIRLGANGAQIGTFFDKYGPGIFTNVLGDAWTLATEAA